MLGIMRERISGSIPGGIFRFVIDIKIPFIQDSCGWVDADFDRRNSPSAKYFEKHKLLSENAFGGFLVPSPAALGGNNANNVISMIVMALPKNWKPGSARPNHLGYTVVMIFAYFGPETTLPVVSVIAAATGFVLAGGRFVTSWIKRRFRPRVENKRQVRSISSLKRPAE